MVFMCTIYKYACRAVCLYAQCHAFQKRSGCAPIEAFALIKTNMVV